MVDFVTNCNSGNDTDSNDETTIYMNISLSFLDDDDDDIENDAQDNKVEENNLINSLTGENDICFSHDNNSYHNNQERTKTPSLSLESYHETSLSFELCQEKSFANFSTGQRNNGSCHSPIELFNYDHILPSVFTTASTRNTDSNAIKLATNCYSPTSTAVSIVESQSDEFRLLWHSSQSFSTGRPIPSTYYQSKHTYDSNILLGSNVMTPNYASNGMEEDVITTDASWCAAASSRIMIFAEVHGKLIMRLRDFTPKPKKYLHRTHHLHRKNYNCKHHAPPTPSFLLDSGNVSWMTHTYLLQHVPKLLRIIIKTASYYCDHHKSSKSDSCNKNNLQQILSTHNITSQHIFDVLKNVSGICSMIVPSHKRGCEVQYYYSLDQAWLTSYLNPNIYGYTPAVVGSNIVLLIVEQRLLHLIDINNDVDDNDNNKRHYCCTNEVCRLYELTYKEPLLFRPLGFKNFKDLIYQLPSIERIYDDQAVGPNGNQWYIQRKTLSKI